MTEQFLFHIQLLEQLNVSKQIILNYICYLTISRSTILERGLIADIQTPIFGRLNKLDDTVDWNLYYKLDMEIYRIETCDDLNVERDMLSLIAIVKQLN